MRCSRLEAARVMEEPKLDPARYQRLKELFVAAHPLAVADRPKFLERECDGDEELFAEVARLLEGSDRATTRALEDPVRKVVSSLGGAPGADCDDDGASSFPIELGDYTVERELGRGGMGIVYVALHQKLQRRVALKLLPAPFLAGESARGAFLKEAQHLAALNHAHIATIFSLEEVAPHTFFTMELVEGDSLAWRLRQTPLTLGETLRLGHQLCLALEAAHTAGIVHLDLKPGNIIIGPDAHAKVLDFGIARSLLDRAPTEEYAPAGTPGYMSPEQILDSDVGPRADFWALGCVLFECLARVPAVKGDGVAQLQHQTLAGDLAWEALPEGTPSRLRESLEQLLSIDADDRPGSAQEIALVLDELLAEEMLPASADPPRSGEAAPLPRAMNALIGRTRELAQIERRLRASPLVTLTGIGGTGKTRLALEAARQAETHFEDGVVWVELARLSRGEDLAREVSNALRLRESKEETTDAIVRGLTEQQTLLVLDNCEHVIDHACALVTRILDHCPRVSILATSRESLTLRGEAPIAIAPLSLPEAKAPLDELGASAAVRLFIERAELHGVPIGDEQTSAVASICRRLDGLPLALELAASRLRLLSIEELAEGLEQRFRILTGGGRAVLPRQQTLRATLDWSYRLLSEPEQMLLRRLAAFADGWTLRAAEEVCSGNGLSQFDVLDLVAALVDKSLVVVVPGDQVGGTRYRFLETVRAYAEDRLAESQEASALVSKFVDYYAKLSAEAESKTKGPQQKLWFQRLAVEHENTRRALEHCLSDSALLLKGFEIANPLWTHWEIIGACHFGLDVLDRLLEQAAESIAGTVRRIAWNAAGNLASHLNDYPLALEYMERAAELCRTPGSERQLAVVKMNQAIALRALGSYEEARDSYEQALATFQLIHDQRMEGTAFLNLGILHHQQGRSEVSLEMLHSALRIAEELEDPHFVASCYGSLGSTLHSMGRESEAERSYEKAISLYEEIGDQGGTARALGNKALIASSRGDYATARSAHLKSLSINRELGYRRGASVALVNLTWVATHQGDYSGARTYLRECVASLLETGEKRVSAHALENAGSLFAAEGHAAEGARLHGSADALRERLRVPVTASDREDIDLTLDGLRETLGTTAFQTHWNEGAALGWQEAMEAVQAALDPEH